MNSLGKAEKAAEDGNVRAVKAAAINEILDKWDTLGYHTNGEIAKAWDVEANISNGDILNCTVKVAASDNGSYKEPKVKRTDDGDHYSYSVQFSIKDTEINKTTP